jgi:signal transduction histidine kinase
MRLARHAWVLVVGTAALVVAQGVLLPAAGVPLVSAKAVDDGFPGIPLATVVGALVGAVILSRHPRHPIGWLFCLGQLGAAAGLTARAIGEAALSGGTASPQAARVAEWIGDLLGSVFALMLLAVLLLLAPHGRLPSRRWRAALLLTLGSYALFVATLLTLAPPARLGGSGQVPADPTVEGLVAVSSAGVFAGLVAGASAVVVRLARARGEERQQMRWIAVASVGLAVVPVTAIAVNLTGRPTPLGLVLALHVAYLAVPVATGFAVLRYRLYDVDRVIGGAVVLTVLVVVASATYLVAVASVGRAIDGRGRPSWLPLAAFVGVVLVLQPVRRGARRAADRLVYGPRASRYAVLLAHSHHLADAVASRSFLTGVAETTARLMGATSCRAAVRLDDGGEVGAVWPSGAPGPGMGAMEVPVRHGGADVGRLVLDLPPQAIPSPSRRRVLREFCERAGPAFRTTGLEESLRAGATRLASVNAQLAGSRQRLLVADDSGRRQVAAAIRLGVATGLREVPDRLSAIAALAGDDPEAAERLVDTCIAATADALEQLRDITRTISPPLLAQRGLYAALLGRRAPRGASVQVRSFPDAAARWPADLETCAYFCCAELLRGAQGNVRVELASDPAGLVVCLTFEPDDDPADPQLEGAADRVEALGGTLVQQGPDFRLTFPVTEEPRPARRAPPPIPG